jgi:catechol 2,3-dioxygenase
MTRDYIDNEGLNSEQLKALREREPPVCMPFRVRKIGHVVLRVTDLDRATAFYRDVLGFQVSDVYPQSMMPGGMVFLRMSPDHHSVALVGGAVEQGSVDSGMHHMAFEVATVDEVIRARDHLRAHKIPITYEGRRRAGCQIAVEFTDPDGHCLEIFWGLDQVDSDNRSRTPADWRVATTLAQALENAPQGQDTTLQDPTLQP